MTLHCLTLELSGTVRNNRISVTSSWEHYIVFLSLTQRLSPTPNVLGSEDHPRLLQWQTFSFSLWHRNQAYKTKWLTCLFGMMKSNEKTASCAPLTNANKRIRIFLNFFPLLLSYKWFRDFEDKPDQIKGPSKPNTLLLAMASSRSLGKHAGCIDPQNPFLLPTTAFCQRGGFITRSLWWISFLVQPVLESQTFHTVNACCKKKQLFCTCHLLNLLDAP